MARYSRNDQAGVELPKTKLTRESLRQALELFKYLRPYRGRFIAALASLFTGSLLSLAFPYLAGSIIDAALHPGSAGIAASPDRTALLLVVTSRSAVIKSAVIVPNWRRRFNPDYDVKVGEVPSAPSRLFQ